MPPFVFSIFLSAFLLFQVQLLLSKYFLPWFGGAPAVWTTCMLTFQTLLLAGYAYAHWLTQGVTLPAQRRIHLSLAGVSVALLAALLFAWESPILPDADWKPSGTQEPISYLLLLLLVSIGLPFFMLSTTNPLLQSWQSRTSPGRSPYRLYAFSNLGSMLGLVSYPLIVQIYVPLKLQAMLWASAYLVFVAGLAWCAQLAVPGGHKRASPATAPAPDAPRRLLWFGLAACASLLLLAITNQITQEVASVPFLWMLPLAVYLLSFILCFGDNRWYSRAPWSVALVAALSLASLLVQHGYKTSIVAQIVIYTAALFIACMACHGELARLKPSPRHLTGYFLTIAAGGAAGGIFVGILAPGMFPGFWELQIGLWACAAVFAGAVYHDRASFFHHGASILPALGVLAAALLLTTFSVSDWFSRIDLVTDAVRTPYLWPVLLLFAAGLVVLRPAITAGAGVFGTISGRDRLNRGLWKRRLVLAALLAFAATQAAMVGEPVAGAMAMTRNFYGMLSVIREDADDPERHALTLRHGQIAHGMQYQMAARQALPTSYYGVRSGIALALGNHPRRRTGGLRIGVVGLGVGTLAAYGRHGDRLRFYEINPAVIRLAQGARSLFTYLDNSPADIEVVPGDARLSLERELAGGGPRNFDVLAIDAFSSDAIPVHLLTREAIGLYLRHLDPRAGILAVHISNRFVNLKPVVTRLARHYGLDIAIVDSFGKTLSGEWASDWILLSRPGVVSRIPALMAAAEPPPEGEAALWTDDYSNLLGALRLAIVHESQAPGYDPATEGLDILDRPDAR